MSALGFLFPSGIPDMEMRKQATRRHQWAQTKTAPKKVLVKGPAEAQPRKTETFDNNHPYSHHLCNPPEAVPKQTCSPRWRDTPPPLQCQGRPHGEVRGPHSPGRDTTQDPPAGCIRGGHTIDGNYLKSQNSHVCPEVKRSHPPPWPRCQSRPNGVLGMSTSA